MLILISPAKTLNLEAGKLRQYTEVELISQSAQLIELLRPLTSAQIGQLMSISEDLALLNQARFANWNMDREAANLQNSKQALLTFDGDVYDGLQAASLSAADLKFAQGHLRILSGLYGVLRPLDLMQAYRLEMGTRLPNPRGKDLYAFWGRLVTDILQRELQNLGSRQVVNLASEEYFKVVQPKLLEADIIQPVFEDYKNGKYKVISFFAKRARGAMARYAIVNRIKKAEKLKLFAEDGYGFVAEASTAKEWVFRRKIEA